MRTALFGIGGFVFLLGTIVSIAMILCFSAFDMIEEANTVWKVLCAEIVGLIGCGIGVETGERDEK